VREHLDLKQFRVNQHHFLIFLVDVHFALAVHLPTLHVPNNLHSLPITMDTAQHAFFSQRERAHEQ
jgi:hypothetical protein